MPPDDRRPVVLVVEDDEALRRALAFNLEVAGYRVRAHEAAEPLLAELDRIEAGCLITDVRLPGMGGLELIRELARRGSRLPVVVVTGFADVPLAVEAMKAGAVDLLEKPLAPGALLAVVERALRACSGILRQQEQVENAAARIATLSSREREVFDGLIRGRLSKQIAGDLGISPRTVEIYRANVMEKLGTRTLAEIVRLGVLLELQGQREP
ncbi:response regulator transcription factor [Benzoatithermus flavus]|uniref:Response regulator n=1 Tax=Benzoatithermus flavus TaxID=3108223 RepID=A0ABU8XWL3_9PROT